MTDEEALAKQEQQDDVDFARRQAEVMNEIDEALYESQCIRCGREECPGDC